MAMIILGDHDLICFPIYKILANTSPKKKAQSRIGSLCKSHLIILANDKILMAIPENKANRKLPFIDLQADLKPSFFQTLNTLKLIDY